MKSQPLGELVDKIIHRFFFDKNAFVSVFVTGNANKLIEVRAILSDGSTPVQLESQSLECKA